MTSGRKKSKKRQIAGFLLQGASRVAKSTWEARFPRQSLVVMAR
jgi:hypothetical protein